jgi:hypothetical protein
MLVLHKPTIKNQGMYTHPPSPNRPWESILMDYILGLLSTKDGNDYFFVVVDRFSKMEILVTCKTSNAVDSTSKIFFEQVWVQFFIPQTIISDRDNRFISTF